MNLKNLVLAALPAVALAFAPSPAARADSLVHNGSFSDFTVGGPGSNPGSTNGGMPDYNITVANWTNAHNNPNDSSSPFGYTFLYKDVAAATGTGANGSAGNVKLWGPGSGVANGFTASPDGGAFMALDGAYQTSALYQTISGLTVGQKYTVSFYWGAAQQQGYDGATQEWLMVGLGNTYLGGNNFTGQSFTTAKIANPNHGFTGWLTQNYTFTAMGTTQVLSFLAGGSPGGVPPFTLLDGVTMQAVPEPASVAMMGLAAAGLAAVVAKRRRRDA